MPSFSRYPWFIIGTCLSLALMLPSCGGAKKHTPTTIITPSTQAPVSENTCIKPRTVTFPPQYSAQVAGTLGSNSLTELSGLSPSQNQSGVFWGINDSGHTPVIYALKQDGTNLGSFTLQGAKNEDWEEVSGFTWKGESWLMISDTGDNAGRRDTSRLYFIKEPDLTKYTKPNDLALDQWHQMDFVYPDGPQNIEASSVSCVDNTVYLISKDSPHNIYTLPLDFESGDTLREAKNVGVAQPLPSNEAENPLIMAVIGKMLMKPTALDFTDDGLRAVITNYRHVYAYQRQPNQTWADALQSTPNSVVDFELSQCESICFLPNSDNIFFGSEGRNGELMLGTIK